VEKEIKIELLKENEIKEAGKLYGRTFNESIFKISWTDESAIKFLKFMYERQPDLFFVAKIKGKIIGGITGLITYWSSEKNLYDLELFVSSDYQGLGIGKKLFQKELEQAIKKYHIKMVEGVTSGEAEFPLSWYKKINFLPSKSVYLKGNAKDVLENLNK
jgi:GNAT superfamily N-acetyltransferase